MAGTVAAAGLTYAALLCAAVALDLLVRPRGFRRLAGLWLLACMTSAIFGLFLAASGSLHVALALALAVQALLLVASNAKYAMLGEPLLFSDLALVGAVFRHPQFYLSAVAVWKRAVAMVLTLALLAVLAWLSTAKPTPHLAGAALCLASVAVLFLAMRVRPFYRLAAEPAAEADTRRLGLYPALLLYWLRWRKSADPLPPPSIEGRASESAPELVIVIQCESFADPVELFTDPALALPGLEFARSTACQWGDLNVSGFGAYTMRTEYGVLFGRDEQALGFRRFDPYLTATREGSYALPARLRGANWRSLFLHPHDMRFYGRHRIMPAGGFAELVGEECFAPPQPGEGRYVTDAAMADTILARAAEARQPTLLYAVTIENHGPWAASGVSGETGLVPGYLRLVRNSDAMLARLLDGLRALHRPALLVFFGDHRPSIPGATAPGGERHTPYVMVRIEETGAIATGSNKRVDLTPAQLHHAILAAAAGDIEP